MAAHNQMYSGYGGQELGDDQIVMIGSRAKTVS